jgi:hypothetical protein
MNYKALVLFFFATIVWCAATTVAFGQDAAASQGQARLKAYTTVMPQNAAESRSASSLADRNSSSMLPLWTFNVSSSRDHNNYSGVMVGRDPFGGGPKKANVPAQIVPIVITTNLIGTFVDFNSGNITTTNGVTTLDPTAANSACLAPPNDVPLTLYQQSPIIQDANFNFGGTYVGNTQYVDAFQRANFWSFMHGNSYHVLLQPVTTTAPIYINVPAADGLALSISSLGPPDFCAPLGIIDINWFDAYLTSTIIPELYPEGVDPGSLPIFLLANVVMASPVTDIFTCCILGYHGATGSPIQTYAPMDFDTTGVFGPGIFDTSVSAHEVGEWMNDPFGDNPVPPWGHIGQQPGCQNNLEVGDPLTGTDIPTVTMRNGYAYHLQELVFFSWFFGAPSIAVNGWFSDNNTFTTDAGPPCM